MKLGFNTAILPEYDFDQIIDFAAENGFACVEVACWPLGKAERRYAGVTHIDMDALDDAMVAHIKDYTARKNVFISAIAYYPNTLSGDPEQRAVAVSHLKKCIVGAERLGVGMVNTFIGRNMALSPEDNKAEFMSVWPGLIAFAEEHNVPVVSPLANITGMNSDVLFQLAPDPSRKYEKAGDLVNGDKRVTLICTESADKEFEREMLALLGDSEYRRYTYKYEHPTARSADSPSDLTPLLENTDDNVFIILSDNEVDIDRILAALASADTSRGRTAPRFVVLGNTRWNRYNTVDRAMFFKNRVIFFSTYHAKRDSETVRAFDDAYIRSFCALPTLFSYRGYDTAMIFAPAMYGDIEYDLEDRRYTPLQTTYRFGQNEGRENHVNRNWTRVNYNSDFTITIE